MTDVSWNYEVNEADPPFTPAPDAEWLIGQEDVDRMSEFRKCIECFLCQDVCHVLRDHACSSRYFGPRFLVRIASLEMHPLDTLDRTRHGRGRGRPRAVQHHEVLHRGLPRGHPHHRQRDHPAQGRRSTRFAATPGAAEGGINAALGNASEDDPEKHAFDTVKGSDYLGDQDAIEILCHEAPDDVYQLEHWGAVFSRTPDGRIAQRPFGAAGEPRTAYAADITGHVLIHVLYEQVMKRDIPTVRGVLRVEARRRRRPLPGRDRLGPPGRRPRRRSARRR